MAAFMGTQINNSATIVDKASAEIADVRCKAVKYDADGGIVLCSTAGEAAIGIAIITAGDADGKVLKGGDVDIQVKDIGLARAGAAIKKGAELATDANGCVVEATAGQFVIGTALEAGNEGKFVRLQINKIGYKGA